MYPRRLGTLWSTVSQSPPVLAAAHLPSPQRCRQRTWAPNRLPEAQTPNPIGNSLVVHWLGLRTFTAGDPGSIPGPGTKIPQDTLHGPKQTNKQKTSHGGRSPNAELSHPSHPQEDLSSPSMLSSGTSSLLAGCQSRETLCGALGAPPGYQGPGLPGPRPPHSEMKKMKVKEEPCPHHPAVTVCINYTFCIPFLWPGHTARRILVPQPGTEPRPSAVRARSPNHWTAREFPVSVFLTPCQLRPH